MKRKQFGVEQIAYAITQAESGKAVAAICRRMGVSEPTFYRLTRINSGIGVTEVRRFEQLEDDNLKLKRLVADLSLDNTMLRDSQRGRPDLKAGP